MSRTNKTGTVAFQLKHDTNSLLMVKLRERGHNSINSALK